MRIGLITADFWPNVGGVAAHVIELGSALAAAGHEVHVLTRPLGDCRSVESDWRGMRVHRPRLPQLRPFCHWMLRRWLRQFCRTAQLDLLHVHGLRPLPATTGLDIPVVFTNHTSGFLKRLERGPRARRRVAHWFDHVALTLAPSEELAAATGSLPVRCPVEYIPNGVDPNRFTPGPATLRGRWGVGTDETVVLLGRRLVEKNGVCVFAEAAGRFIQPGVRIVFAGDGPERHRVEEILRSQQVHHRAVFLGNVPNTDMPDVYRAADVSVLPSFLEATSITGLESMAAGLPLVGTRVGGIPAIVEDERTGLLVPPGDPASLASAINRLLWQPELRQRLGDAARARVISEFAWPVIAERTIQAWSRAGLAAHADSPVVDHQKDAA
ncbi:MAG: glycosyltransferase family 4 protein [Planctomycetaceae bacterium]